MKLVQYILFFLLIIINQYIFSQEPDLNKRLTLILEDVPLSEALDKISEIGNLNISFVQTDLPLDKNVSVNAVDKSLKDIPFLMVTAEGQKENVVEAVQAGVSNYIVKPFTPETFSAKLEKVFS